MSRSRTPRRPPVDEHLVEPETRQELVRGELMEAQPANPPHAEQHIDLGYVIKANVAPGYVAAIDLLTRVGPRSDFATDVCVRRRGVDPQTGVRYLEELAFEVVSEQAPGYVSVRAEDLVRRGVRRLIAIFVKKGEVGEWSAEQRCFVPLPLDGELVDPTLVQPLPIQAIFDAAAAHDAVASALAANRNPWMMQWSQEREQQALVREKHDDLCRILTSRGLPPSAQQQGRIEACTDLEQLRRWLLAASSVSSVEALFDEG